MSPEPHSATPARNGHGRVAMISVHTSPLDQPGTGDAGGMNVYVVELARRLAARDVAVEIYTRATSSALPPSVEAFPGVTVHHVHAGPFEGLTKGELPGQLCVFAREVLRAEARHDQGWYDVVHSHYWLSGQVGALVRDRWSVPLVHSMHTMAKVKNASLAAGDTPEPVARVIGEEQVVEAADMLIANTDIEAKQLLELYDADPARVEVVHPGVDLDVFRPSTSARSRLGLPPDAVVLMFAGRIQPLKAPGRAAARRRGPCSTATRRCGPGSSYPSSAARRAPASSTPSPWPSSPTRSASPTWCASCRRSPSRSSPTGTPRPPWSACRPTTSRSGWSPSRPRPRVRRSWPPPWAG